MPKRSKAHRPLPISVDDFDHLMWHIEQLAEKLPTENGTKVLLNEEGRFGRFNPSAGHFHGARI